MLSFKPYIFLLIIFCGVLQGQNRKLDSLTELIKHDKEDTSKANHLCILAYEFRNSNPKKAIELCEEAKPLIDKFNFKRAESDMNTALGTALTNLGKKEEALHCFEKAARIAMHNKFSYQLARALYGTGITHHNYGEYPEGFDYFSRALEIALQLNNDDKFLSNIYNYLGMANDGLGNNNEALKSMLTSIRIKTKIGDKQGIAAVYNNLVAVYRALDDPRKAIDAANKAIVINKELNNKNWLANNYHNLGAVYIDMGIYNNTYMNGKEGQKTKLDYLNDATRCYEMEYAIRKSGNDKRALADIKHNITTIFYEKALYYTPDANEKRRSMEQCLKSYQELAKIRQELGDRENLAKAANKGGQVAIHLKKYKEAKELMVVGLKAAVEMRSKVSIQSAYICLTELDSLLGDYRSALRHHVLYNSYKDSVQKESDNKKNIQTQLAFEYSLKQSADSLRNLEESNREKLKYDQEIKQQKYFTWGGIIGFAMMLVVAGVSLRANRQKRKDNAIIRQQKMDVEVKQKEILDSIYYAKRIQDSLLPQEKYIHKSLENFKKDPKG
jgi:tetratricopeptide (TPR) repeat protein